MKVFALVTSSVFLLMLTIVTTNLETSKEAPFEISQERNIPTPCPECV